MTYTYSTTLSQPLEHADGALENSDHADRRDGSGHRQGRRHVPVSFNVTIVDDVPQAVADTTAAAEDTAVTYNVITNADGTSDLQGADAPATLTAATLATAGAGTVGFLANGDITFTPAAGFAGAAVINYTITDQDGDTSSSTLTVTVAADSVPSLVSTTNLTVDEDGFPDAAVDTVTARSDETDSTESLTATGTAVVNFGNDVPADLLDSIALVDTAALDGQLKTQDGQSVTFALAAATGDLVGSAGATAVIRSPSAWGIQSMEMRIRAGVSGGGNGQQIGTGKGSVWILSTISPAIPRVLVVTPFPPIATLSLRTTMR